MQIDWLTVGAQIVNFLLLVYLLKRFLYGPIVRAMDHREQLIVDRQHAAEAKEAAAEHESSNYRAQLHELEQQREAILDEAKQLAAAEHAQQLEALRKEIATTRTRWHEEVEIEKATFLLQARKGIAQQACDIARKALHDLVDTELEHQLIALFLRRIDQMDTTERTELAEIIRQQQEPITVATGFELEPAVENEIHKTLLELGGSSIKTRFIRSDDLLCGIALLLPDHKVAWSFEDYLDGLQHSLTTLLTTPGSDAAVAEQTG